MLRFGAYARVSTEEQSSIDAQLATLIPLAVSKGGSIVVTETDVLSGLDTRRPGYNRLLDLARRHEIDGILVYKLDRFGRDHVESFRAVQELSGLGVQVYSATEQIDTPFVRDLMLLLANHESSKISERVKLMQRANVKGGRWQWPAPTGYRITHDTGYPKLEPDARAPLVRHLFDMAASSDYSVRRLRDEAQRMGLTSSKGTVLSTSLVHYMLTNPVYVGDIRTNRRPHGKFSTIRGTRPREEWQVVSDCHEPIVHREVFDKVQAILASHKRFQGDVRHTRWLLTGLAKCVYCGSSMYGARGGRGNFVYACTRGISYGDCKQKRVGGKNVDAFVREQLKSIVITPERRKLAEATVREVAASRLAQGEEHRQNLLRSKREHEEERQRLARRFLETGSAVPKDIYQHMDEKEVDALRIIEQTLATLPEPKALNIDDELSFLDTVNWDEFDDQAWREAAVLLIERVIIDNGGVRGNRWRTPGVTIEWTESALAIRQSVLS